MNDSKKLPETGSWAASKRVASQVAPSSDELGKFPTQSADGEAATSSRTPEYEENSPEKQVPERIARYQLLRILGEGGFGRVYLAHDDGLQRFVAIKVPQFHRIGSPKDAEAYLVEAQILAKLDHPHIVPVYDVGRSENGLPFVVSKFIEGSSLAERIKEARLAIRESAVLVARMAEALQYAHQLGLVHRDVKPGNILLDAANKPILVDFGLALREEDVGKGGGILGTPAYMSPEQASGEGHLVDGRSDIFSLGVVLYELLTGRRPFGADNTLDMLMQIVNVEACPLRQIDSTIPKELERITLKAVAKRASERYPTAQDFADDLQHWLKCETTADKGPRTVKIIPRGLRSFDAEDANFFLELLPGPRDREGLPDTLRFWKNRIEETDGDKTFRVGVIYGPSGCGKSSFVKAGLMPRLADTVRVVYVEAAPEDTEPRLLRGLAKACPEVPKNLSLREAIAHLRRDRGIRQKVVIVIDQFEQWLHGSRCQENAELIQALRQCDGERVQCIVMVRDDFWMALTRFMRELEINLLEGQNSAVVDLFDLRHAQKVLTAYGKAYGTLAENADLTREQAIFLEQAVSGLSQDGKVISVRLALFAEMAKGKAWTPATLKAMGGTEGVGVTFLEETFSAAAAPPEHRYHQKAARAVLKALLPEQGTDIKGQMRSHADLLEASGYAGRPRDFDELLHILDSEIRLITPTDPEGKPEDAAAQIKPGQKYYQLTHDYLVPSLRDWLTRKQKETRRGRAELLLADRAVVWNARPENRQLPSVWQWLSIRWLTQKKNWMPPQRTMMRKAGRYHAARALVLAVLLTAGTITGLVIQNHLEEQSKAHQEQVEQQKKANLAAERAIQEQADQKLDEQKKEDELKRKKNHAAALVGRVFDADIAQVPGIIKEMGPYRTWTDPSLKEHQEKSANNHRKQLHASLALLPVDSGQVDYVYGRLLKAQPQEVMVIREALLDHKANLTEKLWKLLENPQEDQDQRFRAACALAVFAAADARWEKVAGGVAENLVNQKPFVIAQWTLALKGAGKWLIPPMADFLVDEKRSLAQRGLIASVYGSYAADTPDAYVRLEKQLGEQTAPDAIALAKKRTSIGIALMVMGRTEKAWPLFKQSSDPTVRSFLLERLGPSGVDARILLARLDEEKDVTVQRAILMSLGEFAVDRLSLGENLLPRLLAMYQDHPDPGIHGAAAWLLWKWGAADKLTQIDKALATGKVQGNRQWYVNGQGQTMTIVPGPEEFWMGDVIYGRHRRKIGRGFAIASKHITKEQFRAMMKRDPSDKFFAPTDDCPAVNVSWYDAAEYCNELNKRENIPEEQWCYVKNKDGKLTTAPKYLQRTGYRLPTEAEWEYSCRAGAETTFAFGNAEELLDQYCWYLDNSKKMTHPVGTKKPNDLGLFDMHSNAWEWIQNSLAQYPKWNGGKAIPDVEEINVSFEVVVMRGGSNLHPPSSVRSAHRSARGPMNRDYSFGFRVARTFMP